MALGKNLMNPSKLIENIIMIVLAAGILVVGLPKIITSIVNLSNISNLGFSEFFAANGIVLLALGAAVVLGVLGVLGLKGSKR